MYEVAAGWFSKADYSYGFLVPIFSGWWLWSRRAKAPKIRTWPKSEGLPFIFLGSACLAVGTLNYAKEAMQGAGLIFALAGAVMMFCGGWRGLKWAWPAIIFLAFMYPLPNRIEVTVAWQLRRIAAEVSCALLQTLGFPAFIVGQGTVINVGTERLDVEHACSGLGMLLAFGALCVAAGMTLKRPTGDKIVIMLSAIPIAVFSNVLRITATGIVYAYGWRWLGSVIVHDLAGWLMMPIALGLIWLELKVIDWTFEPVKRVKRYEFIKTNYIAAQQEAPLILGRRRSRRAGDGPIPMPKGESEPPPKSIPLPGEAPVYVPSDDSIPLPAGKPAPGSGAIPLPGGKPAP
jgi:exosortase